MATGGEGELGNAVFEAASEGDENRLRGLLRWKRYPKIRAALSWRDPFDRTPLMVAASKGHDDVVRALVEEYGVNIEESKYDTVDNVEFTPLVYAANIGHHTTVQILLKNGASVDHAFPLHRACYASSEGNLKCVELLVQYGANVNQKYKGQGRDSEFSEDETPLSVASEQLCSRIVEFLLEKGADPNVQTRTGNTPLHKVFDTVWYQHSETKCRGACSKSAIGIIEQLVQHGAKQVSNDAGLSPVMVGALNGNLGYFWDGDSLFGLSEHDHAEALELLGSTIILKSSNSSEAINRGYECFYRAKGIREKCDAMEQSVQVESPYGNYNEPNTCDDLSAIKSDSNYLKIVALLIRERILSPIAHHHELCQNIVRYAERCERSPEGRRHALRALQHEAHLELSGKHLYGYAVECLVKCLDPSETPIEDSGLEGIVSMLELAAWNPSASSEDCMASGEIKYSKTFLDNTLVATLNLMSLYANHPTVTDIQKEIIVALINRYVIAYKLLSQWAIHCAVRATPLELRFGPHGASVAHVGDSVLHVYVSIVARRRGGTLGNTNEQMLTILLQSGEDPNQTNSRGYTALHHAIKVCQATNQTPTFHQGVVVPLVEWGCEISRRNIQTGRSALEDCTHAPTRQLLEELSRPHLKRLAARAIRRYRIPYQGVVPASIARLIDIY